MRLLTRCVLVTTVCAGLVLVDFRVDRGAWSAGFSCVHAYAGEAVAPAVVSTLDDYPEASATAILAYDVDRDGIEDLVVAYREGARAFLAAYRTRPAVIYGGSVDDLAANTTVALDTFESPVVLAELPVVAFELSSRDVNADGSDELLAASSAAVIVLARAQSGAGRFELRADLERAARGSLERGRSIAERKILRRLRRARMVVGALGGDASIYATASGARGVYLPDLEQAAAVDASAAKLSVATAADVAAVVTMRLNGDAIDDLVVLHKAGTPPQIFVSVSAATFTVTTTSDAGDGSCDASCTLREAITAANETPELDSIAFDIPTVDAGYDAASGVWKMQPSSDLPAITAPLSIDATTQHGYSGAPVVELDGSLIPAPANGFTVLSPGCLLRGFSIHSFAASLNPLSNTLVCGCGISLFYDPLGDGAVIEGNYIGVTAAGASAPGNGQSGIVVSATGNTIGGTTSAARNVIAGHDQMAGIVMVGQRGNNNTVVGNYVGTDPSGAAAMPNDVGILVSGDHNAIGAAGPMARNVVSGNITAGIEVRSAPPLQGAIANQVYGNYVGTESTGHERGCQRVLACC